MTSRAGRATDEVGFVVGVEIEVGVGVEVVFEVAVEVGFEIEVGDDDLGVLGGEARGRRCPDPSSTAGDQRGPTLESSCHVT